MDTVFQAVRQLFPKGTFPSKAETRKFNGHYGNEIGTINLFIRGPPAGLFLQHLWKSLPSFDRVSILDAMDMYIDLSGGLHLRLDKQEALHGILRLRNQDPIKIHLSLHTRVKSNLQPSEGIKQLLDSFENSKYHSKISG